MDTVKSYLLAILVAATGLLVVYTATNTIPDSITNSDGQEVQISIKKR